MRASRLVAALLVLLATTGGSCSAPVREPAGPPTDGAGPVTEVFDPDARRNAVDVAPGLRPQSLEFVDADTGYLFLAGCDTGCRAALYVTLDGGQSWLNRPLPAAVAAGTTAPVLRVLDAHSVVLVTTEWYLSTDSGRTFTSGGTGLPPADRGVTVDCGAGPGCADLVRVDGRPVPTAPPLAGTLRATARAGDGPIWAVASAGTAVSTVRSADGGRTWQPFGAPLTVADATAVRLDLSPDGADAWLSTGADDTAAAVYLAEAAGWRLVTPKLDRTGSAAAGGGVLAFTRSWLGFLYPDGRLTGRIFPTRVRALRTLRDGTLLVTSAADAVWLGTGTGATRDWVQVRVDVR